MHGLNNMVPKNMKVSYPGFIILFLISSFFVRAQSYFPPVSSNSWDTLSPNHLKWCAREIDQLYGFLDSNNTKAFILLKDGKIVLERYFNGHTPTANWYWASAGKGLTATLIGIAQQNNYLSISDTTTNYLGSGWTDCSLNAEENITIRHQLSMTTGLDDAVSDPFCTQDSCLKCLASPGSRWAYHNAPYTLLTEVIEQATGSSLNLFTRTELLNKTGMNGLYVKQGDNQLFVSTARSMARFGLLMLNKGIWATDSILKDSSYFHAMTNSSQSLNPAYGFLWWLNGKSSYMIPNTQLQLNGSINPSAPADLFTALGKNGQFINVVPSQNLVWIRRGDAPDSSLVPFLLNEAIWKYINELQCADFSELEVDRYSLEVFPNPVQDYLQVRNLPEEETVFYKIFSRSGRLLGEGTSGERIDLKGLSAGVYLLALHINGSVSHQKVIKF